MNNADDLADRRRLRLAAATEIPASAAGEALNKSSSESTLSGMDQQLVDAKIAASEARVDTKFAQLIARLESMDSKLTRIEADNLRTRSTVRTTGFTIVSIILAVLALTFAVFSQSFNLGSKISDVARLEATSILQAQTQQRAPVVLPEPLLGNTQTAADQK
jgi:hypothetical protein